MSLQLLRLQPVPTALALWATRCRLVSPDGDFGYALHALLSAAFRDLAPKPFHYLGGRQGLLAYTSADLEMLRLNASVAPPDVVQALGLDHLDARPFPTAWRTGQRLGFEARVRPVVRGKDGRERDAYLHAMEGRVDTGQAAGNGSIAQRTAIYCEWLATQFGFDGAAQIAEAHLDSFRLTRVLRKAGSGDNGKRTTTNTAGPDVVFTGQLQVGNPPAFNRLLERGIGRHRAFGFGMLLLRPAGSC